MQTALRNSFSLRSAQPLTDDDIRRVAPSVFAGEAHDSRSARYTYVPTAEVLNGLRADELPRGRLVVAVSKHYTAVLDGVIHDTHDPQRLAFGEDSDAEDISGTRCVYGYWTFQGAKS